MSKESTKTAFQKAFSTHMLLNLTPEELDSIALYGWYGTNREEQENFRKKLKKPPMIYRGASSDTKKWSGRRDSNPRQPAWEIGC